MSSCRRPSDRDGSSAASLHVGQRVHHRSRDLPPGKIREVKKSGKGFVYYVRWDGYEHDSGQYPALDLLVPAHDLIRAQSDA